MPQIVCNITLDVSINDSGQIVMAKQGDSKSRLLAVRLTDNGKPLSIESDGIALLNVSREDTSAAYEGLVQSDGTALFVLPATALEKEGAIECDVSVLDGAGGRLTSSRFTVEVERAVSLANAPLESEDTDVIASLLAEETLHTLVPEQTEQGYVLTPALNRKYCVDLSDEAFAPEETWLPIALHLPVPERAERDHWILLYCHAPVRERAGAITLDWGEAGALLFADGVVPQITMGDFDVVCTYSAVAGRWQIGLVQYAGAEATL